MSRFFLNGVEFQHYANSYLYRHLGITIIVSKHSTNNGLECLEALLITEYSFILESFAKFVHA